MKIRKRLFERVLVSVESDAEVSAAVARRVLLSAFDSLGIEVEREIDDSCNCSTTVREYCHSSECHGGSRLIDDETLWVLRTWIDVREGDIIRPPGHTVSSSAAIVESIGPINSWHAAPNASQYAPNESPMEWRSIPVTLKPIEGIGTYTPEHGMKPDAGVEIKVTREELNAIEALGGWAERIGVYEK